MVTQKYVNDLAYQIIGCAIEVHRQLGPGLLESIYEECFCEELSFKELRIVRQAFVPVTYKIKN
jgi:GxxExxY protein